MGNTGKANNINKTCTEISYFDPVREVHGVLRMQNNLHLKCLPYHCVSKTVTHLGLANISRANISWKHHKLERQRTSRHSILKILQLLIHLELYLLLHTENSYYYIAYKDPSITEDIQKVVINSEIVCMCSKLPNKLKKQMDNKAPTHLLQSRYRF